MTVQIVTDSVADLPKEVAERLGITVVPLNVHFGTEVYKDGMEIDAEAFYQRLVVSNPLPTTSQPSVGAFLEYYQQLQTGGNPVVSIHVSAKLSGTFNSAIQAAEQLNAQMSIEVIDSQTGSVGLSLVVIAAAEAAASGADLAGVVGAARKAMAKSRAFFVVDTLEYLQKGGRIGKAQAFLGSVLNVKPILTVQDGEIMPMERVRSLSKAMGRIHSLVEGLAPVASLSVAYSTTPEEAKALAQRLAPLVLGGEVIISQISPVVGTHVGPGCIGVGLVLQE